MSVAAYQHKLVVIGGGAAGFFCAINAKKLNPSLQVIIVEKTGKFLSKVKVSGGGRCNVTHDCNSIAAMCKNYPRGSKFLSKAFHAFFTSDTFNWFARHGITLKTEKDGRVFPVTDSSQTIIDCFMQLVNDTGIQLVTHNGVTNFVRTGDYWQLQMEKGNTVFCKYVCITSGGFPKLQQWQWLQQAGIKIIPPVPSLFTFNLSKHSITALMGLSVPEAVIKIKGTRLQNTGPVLITHWGLSGPGILKLSAMAAIELAAAHWQFDIIINWLPQYNEATLRTYLHNYRNEQGKLKIFSANPFGLPHRLWEYLLQQSGITDNNWRWADLPAKLQNLLVVTLCNHHFVINGKTTFKEEFVTAGGVDLNEVDVQTMQSRTLPHIYFAGEVLNIDGVTGGFNFQNAWTTAFIAAKSIAADFTPG